MQSRRNGSHFAFFVHPETFIVSGFFYIIQIATNEWSTGRIGWLEKPIMNFQTSAALLNAVKINLKKMLKVDFFYCVKFVKNCNIS